MQPIIMSRRCQTHPSQTPTPIHSFRSPRSCSSCTAQELHPTKIHDLSHPKNNPITKTLTTSPHTLTTNPNVSTIQVLQQLYEVDVVSEEAFLAWAGEKAHADEDERVYLHKAQAFIAWLQEEDSDSEEEGEDSD